ncbi:alpha-(1,3)-fucosyltransferase C-like [Ylistrum balloti]|uniref:alpha-(1,3)-fucosyltransferase C-like n=1 Tax=Ylistrum balloti TaxID=509963 RepID=UPI002905D9F2|nr:alpha-(1,3)-fucosyltransferase C-like [Ylistrum balloti]
MSSKPQARIMTTFQIVIRYGSTVYVLISILCVALMTGLLCIAPNNDSKTYELPRYLVRPIVKPIRVHYHNRPPWINLDIFSSCDHKCYLTAGGRIPNSGVTIFHTPYVNERHTSKKKGQIWVFHSMEPPWLHRSKFEKWKLEFNWTMSYRRDSDIMIPYGKFKTREVEQSTWDNETNQLTEKWQQKSKHIAWMVSHCGTPGKRDEYVSMLNQITPVDIYGRCGKKKCIQSKTMECLEPYKFYLSFENHFCEDYITEKSFKVYNSLLSPIPITRGGSNYSMFLPPGSFIDVSKFRNVSHLENYINSLSQNISNVMEYMRWRKHYQLVTDYTHAFCELCRRLHLADPHKYKRLYRDIGDWNRGDKDKIKRTSCKDPQDLV